MHKKWPTGRKTSGNHQVHRKIEHKILGLEQEKQNLEEIMKENQKETLIIETVKSEAKTTNEELRLIQRNVFAC
jgi:hypothetical protein